MTKTEDIIKKYNLTDLFFEPVYVDRNNLPDEIKNNYVSISFEKEDAENYSVGDVKDIIISIIRSKNDYVVKSNLDPMLFYMWYDEQSICLCCCIISNNFKKLPFGCKFHLTNNMDNIINNFLNGCKNGYIDFVDLKEATDDGRIDLDIDLEVYSKILYKSE